MSPPRSGSGAQPGAHAQAGSSFSTSFNRMFSHRASFELSNIVSEEAEHHAALDRFKERIIAAGLQLPPALIIAGDLDATLTRFLRARKYNLDAAAAMLEKSLAWRARVGADTILEQPVDARLTAVVRQCRPSSYVGFDAQHHPIFIERLGKLDGKRMEREGASDDVVTSYHLREMEFMAQVVFREASARAGHTVDRGVTVMDAQGLTLSLLTGFAQRLFRLITAMDSDNYPETCHAIYIVNAGATFGAIWRLVTPFVDKGTRDKVHVVGSGKHMQKVLFEALSPALVPSFLGGQLDYEAVRQQWLAKMDAAIAQRQKAPQGQQPPVVIPPPAPQANGHYMSSSGGGSISHAHSAAAAARHGSSTGGSSGTLPALRLLHVGRQGSSTSTGGGLRHSAVHSDRSSEDGWATPMSAASRMSSASVYYDLPDSAHSPLGGSPQHSAASSDAGAGLHFAPHAAAGHAHAHAVSSMGPSSPGGTSAGGSLSVGVSGTGRAGSQLSMASGFTAATVGQSQGGAHHAGAGGLPASAAECDAAAARPHAERQRRQQPACGCGCVIS